MTTPFKSSGSGLYTFSDPRKPTSFAKPRATAATKPTTYAWAKPKPTPAQVKARGAMTIADLGGPKSVSAQAKKATSQTLRDTSNDRGTNGKRLGGGTLSAVGKMVGQDWAAKQAAAASQTPKYNSQWASQIEAYANAMTGMDLASSKMDLAAATAESDYARATASARMAEIDAGYNAAMAHLQNQLAENGDQKKFLADKLALDIETQRLKEAAFNDAKAANARQPEIVRKMRESVETNYNADLSTYNIQEGQVTRGRDTNTRESEMGQRASGSRSRGYAMDRADIMKDWTSAMGLIAEDKNRLTDKRISQIRELDEADQVIGDRTKEYDNQIAQIDVGKKLLVLGYWRDINEIDHRQKAQQISAKEAKDKKAAAKKQAAADIARAGAIERAAQARHQQEIAAINAQKDSLRTSAAETGMFGTPPPQQYGWGGPTSANKAAAAAPKMPDGRTYVPTAKFGEQGNPFTPSLKKSWASTNVLGIDDNEFKKIGIVANWESGGNPQVAWQKFVDYVNYFKWAQSEQERTANAWYGR
jgi:hypothetical protein